MRCNRKAISKEWLDELIPDEAVTSCWSEAVTWPERCKRPRCRSVETIKCNTMPFRCSTQGNTHSAIGTVPSPNPRFAGLAVMEAARLFLQRSKRAKGTLQTQAKGATGFT